jgi:hypothetical protein
LDSGVAKLDCAFRLHRAQAVPPCIRPPRDSDGLCISSINRKVNGFPAERTSAEILIRQPWAGSSQELWRLAKIASPMVAVGDDLDDRKDSISWRSACF